MYHFNLLPSPEQKQTRWWMIRAQLNLGFVMVNIAIIGLIALFWQGNTLIENAQAESDNKLQALQLVQTNGNGLADIQTLNGRIQTLRSIQLAHPDVLLDLQDITTSLTDGILLTSLSLDYEEHVASLVGTAATRTDLESFQTSIEESENLQLKTFPFEAFTQPEDIPFTITLTIKDLRSPATP